MDIRERLRDGRYLLFDGGLGTMLQAAGMPTGVVPELWVCENRDVLLDIHRRYVSAGSDVITTCTFSANRRKLGDRVEQVIRSAVEIAREAGAPWVALDIGPTGGMLKPLGDMDFDEAYDLFAEQVRAGVAAGADLVIIETMTDLNEARAAVLAVKENSELPVFCTLSYEKGGRTFLGADASAAAVTLCGLGVDAVGVNCSLGPGELKDTVARICGYSTVPVIVQANAGLPRVENGRTLYDLKPAEYADRVAELLEYGVQIVGGCCGTTPEYIAEVDKKITDGQGRPLMSVAPVGMTKKTAAVCSDRTLAEYDGRITVVGERLNPTGKKRIAAALRAHDYDALVAEAISEEEHGAQILDVNAGLPDIDETATLRELVTVLQGATSLPLQIDTADAGALETAVRRYNGKALINSVNGSEESMTKVLPIVRKYGAAVICLTLDEKGIPGDAEGRIAIARRIMDRAEALGIPSSDLIVDGLVMTVATDQSQAAVTLETVRRARTELGLNTTLGVSNISFGLPNRELVNAAFLAGAFANGLNLPIIDPTKDRYMQTVNAYRVLADQDEGAAGYIDYCLAHPIAAAPVNTAGSQPVPPTGSGCGVTATSPDDRAGADGVQRLRDIIISGNKALIAEETHTLLASTDPIELINTGFIPALDRVGELYESGRFFLPQLMAAAETAKRGFDIIKASSAAGRQTANAGTAHKILIATVKGDIHDIGKNIVRMLLENYGYDVIDLGKDVDPQLIVDTVLKEKIRLVGLSALMTTTVRSMKETIDALHAAGADCKIMVGGAVLNEIYAREVGADFYAKDAAASARIAAEMDW